MAHFREISDQRIRQLAETLKRNGLAASETEAINMAKNMTQTESRVNEHFTKSKDEAVMNTRGGLQVEPREDRTQELLQARESREKEVTAQEPAAKSEEAAPVPPHENNFISEAIQNVQNTYKEPQQQINLDADLQQDNLAAAVSEQPATPTAEAAPHQEATPQVVEAPLPEDEAPQAPIPQADSTPATSAEQQEDEDGTVERTQEVFEKPPKKDLSSFAESQVNLASVFGAK